MAIRVDPRRLSLLKELAAGQGLRPGQLVQRWIEERLDAERQGLPVAQPEGASRLAQLEATVASLVTQVTELASRAADRASTPQAAAPAEPTVPADPPAQAATEPAEARPRRGRPPKATGKRQRATAPTSGGRIALHDEIAAVIGERGPSTAAEIADAIRDRGHYHAPRSSRPLDAATVNSRVSNPVYRSRFVRSGGRIDLVR